MRFALTAVAAGALLAACATITETEAPETETEASVEITSEAPAEPIETADAATDSDPYLWLEEGEGEEALAWVNAQNDRSLAAIKDIGVYDDNYAKALDLATSNDRIPYGSVRDGMAAMASSQAPSGIRALPSTMIIPPPLS